MVKNMKKKGESGAAKNFVSRNAAVRKLQITLADFRRICILKGIYPREPRNKKKANKGSTAPTTFYYSKDIQYLLHEPVIAKFRDHKVFARKLAKALGKEQFTTAQRLEENRPVYTLDHIIKERYPTFLDALRDVDDALSMLFLFASIPSDRLINSKIIQNCDRLCREFEHYVILSKSLRKVFLSIKGIYYQAEIKGQDVTWLVPYKFSQHVPTDVDFRIMLTFLEFHQTFVGFINFRLFTELGLVYPPKIDLELDDDAAGLGAFEIRRAGLEAEKTEEAAAPKKTHKQIKSLNLAEIADGQDETEGADDADMQDADDANDADNDIDDFTNVGPARKEGEEEQIVVRTTSASTNLFSSLTFYLAREVPRYSLEFVIKSFGGKVSWDPILGGGSPLEEADTSITHHICDRPTQDKKFQGRIYLQPQWVYDCINKGQLQRIDLYTTGAVLPPHLSPFVKVSDGAYDPEEALSEVEEDEEEEEEVVAEEESAVNPNESVEQHQPEQIEAAQAQIELEAEAAGVPFSQFPTSKKRSRSQKSVPTESEKLAEDGKEMAKMMMTNKEKKLYKRMKSSTDKQETEKTTLRARRKELAKKAK